MVNSWKPIFAGVLCYFIIHYLNEGIAYLVIGYVEDLSQVYWFQPLSYWLALFKWVLPGVVAGYLTSDSGIKIGALVGAASVVIISIPSLLTLLGVGFPWEWLAVSLNQCLISAFMNAVGGGAGELARQKKCSQVN